MQYKRILMSCLIVILILCTSVVAIGAADEPAPLELAVEVSSSTAISKEPIVLNAGDSFEVSISINNNPGIKGLELWLEYDPQVLTVLETEEGKVDCTIGKIGFDKGLIVYKHSQQGKSYVKMVIDQLGSSAFTDNGDIITLKFKVNETAHGNVGVSLNKNDVFVISNELKRIDVEPTFNAKTISVHKFSADKKVVEPTCTEGGYTAYTCVFEGCTETAQKGNLTDALGHDFASTYTVDTPATCIAKGSESRHCSRCDVTTDAREIAMIPHVFGEWTVVTPATCVAKGSEKRTCTTDGCTEAETRETEIAAHVYETEWTIDKEATCTEEGSKSYHCANCDDKKDVTVIEKIAHTYGDWSVTKEATCTEKGTETRTCSACNGTEARDVEAKGHTSVNYEDVEATKDAVGYTGGTYCSVCNQELTPRTEIPMLPDYTWIYILVAVVVVVAVGGGVCAYLFVFKKKKNA